MGMHSTFQVILGDQFVSFQMFDLSKIVME